ncbi:MAG: inositol monophosphatase [Nitrospirae bacterium]|nr:MAG: inositol monophosphatase [Nitrospirota bacterium]
MPMPSPPWQKLEEYTKVAIEAAQLGACMLQACAKRGFEVERKTPLNLVTDADRESERAVVAAIRRQCPDHQILAEEEGFYTTQRSPWKWIIDPLDGTTNFAHGFPAYAVSIGLEYEGHCVLGVVIDPTRDEVFVGITGKGATLNGLPIQVSHVTQLDQALLVTGFGYDLRETDDNNLAEFCQFSLCTQGVRRTGSAVLDLCYVACGRFDAFWELTLNPWDTAAGVVIVREAGGMVTNYQGAPFSIYEKKLVASNGRIHQECLKVLQRVRGQCGRL